MERNSSRRVAAAAVTFSIAHGRCPYHLQAHQEPLYFRGTLGPRQEVEIIRGGNAWASKYVHAYAIRSQARQVNRRALFSFYLIYEMYITITTVIIVWTIMNKPISSPQVQKTSGSYLIFYNRHHHFDSCLMVSYWHDQNNWWQLFLKVIINHQTINYVIKIKIINYASNKPFSRIFWTQMNTSSVQTHKLHISINTLNHLIHDNTPPSTLSVYELQSWKYTILRNSGTFILTDLDSTLSVSERWPKSCPFVCLCRLWKYFLCLRLYVVRLPNLSAKTTLRS